MSVFRNLLMANAAGGLVTDGLHFHLDALNNTGHGIVDTTATEWVDLIGGNNIPIDLTKIAWQDKMALQIENDFYTAKTPNSIFSTSGAMTMEVIAKKSEKVMQSTSVWIANLRSTSAVYGGEIQVIKRTQSDGGQLNGTLFLNGSEYLTGRTEADRGYFAATISDDFTYTTYLNGVKTESRTGTKGRVVNTPVKLFSAGWYSGFSFAGTGIFAVRIYDRALSESEIAQNYRYDKKRYGV